MKSLKKLWAMLLVFTLLVPAISVSADDSNLVEIKRAANEDIGIIYNYPTTDDLSTSNTTSTGDKRISGSPTSNVTYRVVSDYDYVSGSYYDFEEVSGSAYNTPIPTYYTEPSYGYYTTPTPTVYDEPSGGYYNTPTPTVYDEPSGGYYNTPTPVPTVKPTPYQNPTVTPVPTVKPTPYQNPITTPIQKPDPQGVIYVTPVVRTPQKKTYDVDLEVGRLAHIKPEKPTQDTRKSSNTGIINDPRLATGSFNIEYEARANKPGQATLTFGTSSEAFTEEWNVNVFCRPLDFEKTEYVVEKKSGRDGYITLYLKYFEYEYEYAYDFNWNSSDTSVAFVAGATTTTTFARFCVKKPGVTIITVSDKYGNSSQCALIVKDADVAKATPVPTATPKPTKAPKPTTTPEPTATPKPTKAPKPTATPTPTEEAEWGGLTAKQYKKQVKASGVNLTVTQKAGKLVIKWNPDSENDLALDGYEIQVKRKGTKSYKTVKVVNIEPGDKLTWSYTNGVNKKTYYVRVRGFVNFGDTKIYTGWSTAGKAKFKKSSKK